MTRLLALIAICALALSPVARASSYSTSRALTDLYLSYAAYCGSVISNQEWNCKWCKHTPSFELEGSVIDSTRQTAAFVGYDESEQAIKVVFRGTHNLDNWWVDLDADTTTWSVAGSTSVHSGFLGAMQQLSTNGVQNHVTSLLSKHGSYTPVHVTGHSLGAAIAMLFAVQYKYTVQSNVDISVYNYGQPRVGLGNFASWFPNAGIPHFRVVNENDVVPHVPPEWTGFTHDATEMWYSPCNTYNSESCYGGQGRCIGGEDSSCSDSVDTIDMSVQDHLHYFGLYEDCTE